MLRILAALSLALIPTALVTAQDSCPATATCYEGHELEFSTEDGPLQFLVIATTVKTTTTLDGQSTTETATLVEFALIGDKFEQRGEPLTYGKAGVLRTADVGDSYGIAELSDAN